MTDWWIAVLLVLLLVIMFVDFNQKSPRELYTSGASLRTRSERESPDTSRTAFDVGQTSFYSRYTTPHN